MMLHLWIAKAGHVKVSQVEYALKRISREDIINRCIHGNLADDSATQLASGKRTVSHVTLSVIYCIYKYDTIGNGRLVLSTSSLVTIHPASSQNDLLCASWTLNSLTYIYAADPFHSSPYPH